MYDISYRTPRGAHVLRRCPTLEAVAAQLKRLWQARIEAFAYDARTGEYMGAVYKDDAGHLTWYYWREER